MGSPRHRLVWHIAPALVMLVAVLACNLVGAFSPTPTELPTTVPPTSTPEPAPTSQPPVPSLYRVAFVANDDALNVRAGPGTGHEVIGMLAYDATDIEITGEGQAVGTAVWVPIRSGELSGWVHRYFLTEQMDSVAFCDDTRVGAIVETVKTAVSTHNGESLARVVYIERGLLIRYNWWNTEVRFSFDGVSNFFTDLAARDWGVHDGSGLPITGSAAEVIVPLLEKDLLVDNTQVACNRILAGGSAGLITLPPEYEALNYYSVHRPPPDQEQNTFDWGTWVIGIEYWNGEPWLSFLVHYEWEI